MSIDHVGSTAAAGVCYVYLVQLDQLHEPIAGEDTAQQWPVVAWCGNRPCGRFSRNLARASACQQNADSSLAMQCAPAMAAICLVFPSACNFHSGSPANSACLCCHHYSRTALPAWLSIPGLPLGMVEDRDAPREFEAISLRGAAWLAEVACPMRASLNAR